MNQLIEAKLESIKKELLKFFIDSIPNALKYFFVSFSFLFKNKINMLPKRFEVTAIVECAKLTKREYKSAILENLNKIPASVPKIEAVGLTPTDLEVLLQGKYLNHRSKFKRIYDRGPFVTSIAVPLNSQLIVIKAEGEDIEKTKEAIRIIYNDLKNRFNSQKDDLVKTINLRLTILNEDLGNIQSQLKKIARSEKEFGYNPILQKQKIDLSEHETKLRYMIYDIKGQLSRENSENFKLLSMTESKYPVTTRRVIYFLIIIVVSIFISLFVLFFSAVKVHTLRPPLLPEGV
jgi:hypothetical protein